MLLPAENQVPGSLTYIAENAYGQEILSGVFEARYRVEGNEVTLFAQACENPETATSHWESLRDFYSKYGSLEEPFEQDGAKVFAADMFGQWNVIALRGNALLGAVNADDREAALKLVKSQMK
ncbi:MAG: DUF6599 family protein, partial [Oceanipulchritudo sp.]